MNFSGCIIICIRNKNGLSSHASLENFPLQIIPLYIHIPKQQWDMILESLEGDIVDDL